MKIFLRILFYSCTIFACNSSFAQFVVSGTVYDSTKMNLVDGVKVQTKNGAFVYTDSLGKYSINVTDGDSIIFSYKNKATLPFAVNTIADINNFDIWLHTKVKGRIKILPEVIVRAKSYRQDSIENRMRYADVFENRVGKVGTSTNTNGGVGLDINDLINLFRFRRNKQLKAFKNRLEMQERERYVTYRFNKTLVSRITALKNEQLDSFMVKYRPDYEFVVQCDDVAFNQYILNASYHFKEQLIKQ